MLYIRTINQGDIKTRLSEFFESYSKEVFNLYKEYAQYIEQYFWEQQGSAPAEERGRYWTNHTFRAANGFYAKAYQFFGKEVGIEMGNETWYAYNLEHDYGGRFAAFPDLIAQFAPQMEDALDRIVGRI